MGTADKNTVLLGECKWTNEKVDLSILEALLEKGDLFSFKNKIFIFLLRRVLQKDASKKQMNLEM